MYSMIPADFGLAEMICYGFGSGKKLTLDPTGSATYLYISSAVDPYSFTGDMDILKGQCQEILEHFFA